MRTLSAAVLPALGLAGVALALALPAARAAEAVTTTTVTETFTTASTETQTETTLETQTVTEPATTVEITRTTRPLETTAEESSSSGGTPGWVWVLLGVLIAALIGVIAWLVGRGRREVPVEDRRRRLGAAVSSWISQGWAIESQSDVSAVLQRSGERLVVSVDAQGNVTSGPLGVQPPPPRPPVA